MAPMSENKTSAFAGAGAAQCNVSFSRAALGREDDPGSQRRGCEAPQTGLRPPHLWWWPGSEETTSVKDFVKRCGPQAEPYCFSSVDLGGWGGERLIPSALR